MNLQRNGRMKKSSPRRPRVAAPCGKGTVWEEAVGVGIFADTSGATSRLRKPFLSSVKGEFMF